MKNRLREFAKAWIFWAYVHILRPAQRRWLGRRGRQRLIILIYHRVNDEFRDSITVSVAQFAWQMRLVRQHCMPVRLEDFSAGRIDRSSPRPLVAITFDDGYLDNYENALPILRKYEVPATFFVSTGMIGTDQPFEHDLQKLGRGLPTMTWDQLREMRDLGFQIGSHTVSHINCANAPPDVLRQELADSRDSLRHELGVERIPFAYPFGGREDINPTAIELIKEAGYDSCYSAYEDYVGAEFDRFDIPRTNISHNFSKLAFRARLEGFAR